MRYNPDIMPGHNAGTKILTLLVFQWYLRGLEWTLTPQTKMGHQDCRAAKGQEMEERCYFFSATGKTNWAQNGKWLKTIHFLKLNRKTAKGNNFKFDTDSTGSPSNLFRLQSNNKNGCWCVTRPAVTYPTVEWRQVIKTNREAVWPQTMFKKVVYYFGH